MHIAPYDVIFLNWSPQFKAMAKMVEKYKRYAAWKGKSSLSERVYHYFIKGYCTFKYSAFPSKETWFDSIKKVSTGLT